MKKHLKTEAIVLKKKNLLNKDKIVILFTHGLGKLGVFAKGVRKITSRRLPHLETGNLIKIELDKRGDRFYLRESALISGFYKIKNDYEKLKYLYSFLFVIDKMLPENQEDLEIYRLTKDFLKFLSEREFTQNNLDSFFNTLLYKLGYIKDFKGHLELKKVIEQIIDEKLPEVLI